MAQAVEEWYRQMPIITRSYLTAAVVTTVGCTLEVPLSRPSPVPSFALRPGASFEPSRLYPVRGS
jgi:hypothetical protein